MNLLIPLLIATVPVGQDLNSDFQLDLQQLESELNQTEKPKGKSPLEKMVEDFEVNCNGFYGCGAGYKGAKW